MKFFSYKFLMLGLIAGGSVHCTRPANPVNVECGSNQKKDASGKCVSSTGVYRPDPNAGASLPPWGSGGSGLDPDSGKKQEVTSEFTGTPVASQPSDPSASTEQTTISKAIEDINTAISGITPAQKGSAFFLHAAPSKTGAYGLTFRSTEKDVKNLSVSYPENASSYSAATGLSIQAEISWEQTGKKCRLENTSFAISEYSKEKPVTAVCQ